MLGLLFRRKWTIAIGAVAARYAYKYWQENPELQKKVKGFVGDALKAQDGKIANLITAKTNKVQSSTQASAQH
jgi:hypothetical protein